MSSKRDHESVGTLAAWKAYLDFVRENGLPPNPTRDTAAVIASRWMGCKIAMLPDQLEPAGAPEHRGMYHSRDLERLLEDVQRMNERSPNATVLSRVLMKMAVAAYNSHIELDAMTSMSVPDYRRMLGQ